MPSVFESVSGLLAQGDTMSKLGGVLGTDSSNTQRAVQSATPALLSGLADKVREPGGSGAVMNMLDAADRSPQSGIDGFLGGDAKFGTSMLDGIFGSDRGGLLSGLASNAGVSSGIMSKLLPMLAPLVMGVLAKRRAADGLNEAGLANLLAGEKADMERGGLLGSVGGLGKGAMGAAAAGTGAVGAAAARGGATVRDRTANVPTPNKPSRGKFGWLWWLLGALVLLAVAAWALAQCSGGDDLTDAAGGAVDAVEDAADDATDAAGDAVDAVEDAADDATDAAGDAADEVTDAADDAADAVMGADLQPDVDAALSTAGVAGITAVAGDDGVVTLTGEAASEDDKAAAEAAAAGVEGVESVDNQITVAEAAGDEDAADDAEEESEAPESGSTINELLDLDPITFAVNSADITDDGKAVLAGAVEFMTANPDVNVEIGGHTDSDGGDADNLTLSQNRADAVKAFLESEGVDGARMTTKGYGEAEPKVENDTPENKAINRRIEFTIQ